MEEHELSKEKIASLILEGKDRFYLPCIFEVGCYDGKDSRELAKALNRDSAFNLFEADQRSIDILLKSNTPDLHLNLIPFALGNVNGPVDFYLSDSETRRHSHNPDSWSASSSLRKPKTHLDLFKDVQFNESIKVQCIKLDTWYATKQEKLIVDFIWVDINGAEEDFILGGLHTLNAYTRYLYIEFSDKELYEGQISKDKILALLPNFELIGTYNFQGNFGNILLKNKSL